MLQKYENLWKKKAILKEKPVFLQKNGLYASTYSYLDQLFADICLYVRRKRSAHHRDKGRQDDDLSSADVCDNTGVAKGTIGMGRVLDINVKMSEKLEGFVEGQGDFGKNAAGNITVNALYGSKGTDLYANTSYRYQEGNEEFLTLQ